MVVLSSSFTSGPVHKWIGFSVPTRFRGFYSEYYLWGFPPTSKTVLLLIISSYKVSSGLRAAVPRAFFRDPWFHGNNIRLIDSPWEII